MGYIYIVLSSKAHFASHSHILTHSQTDGLLCKKHIQIKWTIPSTSWATACQSQHWHYIGLSYILYILITFGVTFTSHMLNVFIKGVNNKKIEIHEYTAL